MRSLPAAMLAACLATIGQSALAKIIEVTSYGAVANDGKDDAAAINAAIRAAAAGDSVNIPAGTFDLASTINAKSNVSVLGAGAGASVLRDIGTSSHVMVSIEGVSNVSFGNIALEGNNNIYVSQGIYAGSASKLNIHDLKIANLTASTGLGPHAIFFASAVTDSNVSNNTISNIGPSSTWGAGIRVAWGSSHNQIVGNRIEKTGRGGILCNDQSSDLLILRNTVAGSGGEGLGIELWGGCNRSIIESNTIDHWLSVDSSNQVAVRRNAVSDPSGAYRLAGLELVDSHDVVFAGNTVDGGQHIGISISGAGVKERVYWGHNMIASTSTWGIQIQGERGGARQMYFYQNTFRGARRAIPQTMYAPQGHGVRFNGDASQIVFDGNAIVENEGVGVQFGGESLSKLRFIDNVIARNAKGAVEPGRVAEMLWAENHVKDNGRSNKQPASTAGRAAVDTLPRAAIVVPAGAVAGQPVSLQLRFKGKQPVAHLLWDLSDGLPSTDAQPTQVYAAPGLYRVTAVAWDQSGEAALCEVNVSIAPAPPATTTTTTTTAAGGELSATPPAANVPAPARTPAAMP